MTESNHRMSSCTNHGPGCACFSMRLTRLQMYKTDSERLLNDIRRRLSFEQSQTAKDCVKLINKMTERYTELTYDQ